MIIPWSSCSTILNFDSQNNLAFSVIGHACFLLNQWEEAIPKLEKALEMKRIIYEEKAERDVVSTCHLLARALFENHKYRKALTYFEEALRYFEVSQSPDEETNCGLHIALCHKSLKNHDIASAAFEKVKVLCARESVSDEMREEFHKTMAIAFADEAENTDKSKDGQYYHDESKTQAIISMKK